MYTDRKSEFRYDSSTTLSVKKRVAGILLKLNTFGMYSLHVSQKTISTNAYLIPILLKFILLYFEVVNFLFKQKKSVYILYIFY